MKPIQNEDDAENKITGGVVAAAIFMGLEIISLLIGYIGNKPLFEIEDYNFLNQKALIGIATVLAIIFLCWLLKTKANYIAPLLIILFLAAKTFFAVFSPTVLLSPLAFLLKISLVMWMIFFTFQKPSGVPLLKEEKY